MEGFLRRTRSLLRTAWRSAIGHAFMLRRELLAALLLATPLALIASSAITAAEQKKPGEEAVFELREASAFAKAGRVNRPWHPRGQIAECTAEPDKQVKAYPKLRSSRPCYGSIRLGATLVDAGSGPVYRFVVDESGGTGKGYDRVYFDGNADLDLTNDPVVQPLKEAPSGAVMPQWKEKQIIFEYVTLPIDYGPGVGIRPYCLLPRLVLLDEKRVSMQYVTPVERHGKIRVGTREYEALLGQAYVVTGRFDSPVCTELWLEPLGRRDELDKPWWDVHRLGAMRSLEGRFYTFTPFSASPTGDRLTVRPYRGDWGVFCAGPGPRKMDEKTIEVRGALRSPTRAFPVGLLGKEGYEPMRECRVPVGDYLPSFLTVKFGRLSIALSENYHSEGHARSRCGRSPVYFVQIRKDKPYVLDFSNKPDVMFTDPAKDAVFKPGDEVKVAAVLVDPALDIMIRSLQDERRKEKVTYKLPDGKEQSYERSLSLDPVVTIKSSSGKEVASGKMPFG